MSDRGEIFELDEGGAERRISPGRDAASVTTRSAARLRLADVVPVAVTIGLVALAVSAASRTPPLGGVAAQPTRSALPSPTLGAVPAMTAVAVPVRGPILIGPPSATPVLPPAATPTPIRPPDPISFAAGPSVGTLTFAYSGQRWTYRGATGELVRVPAEPLPAGTIARSRRADGAEATLDTSGKLRLSDGRAIPQGIAAGRFKTLGWSPSGARLALGYALAPLEIDARSGPGWLHVWDLASNDVRVVYRAPAGDPNFQPTFQVVSWSPDERYLAIREIWTNSASTWADGLPLSLVDLKSGSKTDLGRPLAHNGWLVWRAPHTAIYVAGGGRETWRGKQLRSWSPESGFRDLTMPSEIALAPVLSPDTRSVLFVAGPVSEYIPNDFFAGRGAGARRLDVLDLGSGKRSTLPAVEGYVQEGVRPSKDGSARLELRRPLGQMSSPALPIEVHYIAQNGKAYILLRLPQLAGFGYYGAFPSLVEFEWDEGQQ